MARYRYIESIVLTIDEFKADPVLAYKLRDEYHRVIVTDSKGADRLVIHGKSLDEPKPKRSRRSVK
jgi:hypothetical protein